jgi:predicted metalloprotease
MKNSNDASAMGMAIQEVLRDGGFDDDDWIGVTITIVRLFLLLTSKRSG